MWTDQNGDLYFTSQDLHDAGVTRRRFPDLLGRATCRAAWHGWAEWRDQSYPCPAPRQTWRPSRTSQEAIDVGAEANVAPIPDFSRAQERLRWFRAELNSLQLPDGLPAYIGLGA